MRINLSYWGRTPVDDSTAFQLSIDPCPTDRCCRFLSLIFTTDHGCRCLVSITECERLTASDFITLPAKTLTSSFFSYFITPKLSVRPTLVHRLASPNTELLLHVTDLFYTDAILAASTPGFFYGPTNYKSQLFLAGRTILDYIIFTIEL